MLVKIGVISSLMLNSDARVTEATEEDITTISNAQDTTMEQLV